MDVKTISDLAQLGAGLGIGLAAFGVGIGIGIGLKGLMEAVSRQPEASGKIQTMLLLGAALAEATAIYGLVIALLVM